MFAKLNREIEFHPKTIISDESANEYDSAQLISKKNRSTSNPKSPSKNSTSWSHGKSIKTKGKSSLI